MSDLIIKGTSTTPEINFKANGELEMSGKSIPSNAHKLFDPVLNWLEKYNSEVTIFSVKLEYFNTSTSKVLYDILNMLESKHENGGLTIKWYYEEGDEDVLDTGHYYQSMMNTPFEFYVMSEYELIG